MSDIEQILKRVQAAAARVDDTLDDDARIIAMETEMIKEGF